jgi:pyruvate dehydrogenase E1 component beta subunit
MQNHEVSDQVTFAQEIHRILELNLKNDPKVILAGLGVNDPKGVFGTTLGLHNLYGNQRVIETPTSENAMTGIAVGLAISGFRPIVVHQRLDFFILAMDQLVNSAAKWYYMFGSQQSVPLTVRLIIGRGWGQGPTHSQILHSWFTHIPGLKVVMPAFTSDVAGLLQASIDDPNPVIFLEDRWVHNQKMKKSNSSKLAKIEIGKASIVKTGSQLTVVSSGYLTLEALKAVSFLEQLDVSVELVDLRSLKPIDEETILNSVKKTRKLLVVDSGHAISSYANEIIKLSVTNSFDDLEQAPQTLTLPDVPEPTSHGVIGDYRITAFNIAEKILQMLGLNSPSNLKDDLIPKPIDVPDPSFTGPF